jgi:hypothetical protein
MFVRAKKSGRYEYLQVVQNERVDGRVRQRVIATLGRVDQLQEEGHIDALLSSGSRFAQNVAVMDAHKRGALPPVETVKIGPPLVFERLWGERKVQSILEQLLIGRKYEFPVERAIFMTVLHRLFVSGSDRAAEVWSRGYRIEGIDEFELHHLYRAMAWLGEELPADQQGGATPFAPRCTKDLIEERLFAERRDLFSSLSVVFFDTTSVYFEGEGGQTLGDYGLSKDHRGDRQQMVIGVILDEQGRPICCELWPGNTTDVKTLIPIVDRLRGKFNIDHLCIVADRGMISKDTVAKLRKSVRNVSYILGVRMRAVKTVRQTVLADQKPFETVHGPRKTSKDPAPLKVKDVVVGKTRYIVCHNDEQARKDEADRRAIVESLQDKLKGSDKALVGNKGYRKYLRTSEGKRFEIDTEKIKSEAGYDGKWVLQTDLNASAKEVALRYKDLWMVEAFFRSLKSIMENRPIYHKCDETIRGHVFCSFLALVLFQELQLRLVERGWSLEWARLKDDLDVLEDVRVECSGQSFVIRSQTRGDAGKALQAAGVALGPTVRVAQDKNPRV